MIDIITIILTGALVNTVICQTLHYKLKVDLFAIYPDLGGCTWANYHA